MGRTLFAHLIFLQAVSLAAIAWAIGGDRGDRGPAGLARLENSMLARIDVTGTLKCPMPERNTGEGCTLQLVDRRSGEVYRVRDSANEAMRLFQAGNREVIARGSLQGDALTLSEIRGE